MELTVDYGSCELAECVRAALRVDDLSVPDSRVCTSREGGVVKVEVMCEGPGSVGRARALLNDVMLSIASLGGLMEKFK